MTLGIRNDGNREAFIIRGFSPTDRGCIIVRDNAVLDLAWISTMENVDICVEGNGKIVFDSDDTGAGNRPPRNTYTFDGVVLNLSPEAEIQIGNANINLPGAGLVINTPVETEICGPDFTPAIPGGSGNFTWTNRAQLSEICKLLSLSILPVEYLYFKSTFLAQERAVRLNWATAKEWENSHFEIERAVNGVRSWEKIGEVKGAGWSEMPVEYFFTDEQLPLTGGNIFYRLRQVDFNGDFAYSEVVSARVPSMQFTQGVWRVFPNPTNGNAFRIELLDPKRYNGETLTANLITPLAGKKPLGGNTTQAIGEEVLGLVNVHGKGVYILEITWGNRVEHIKVLKQ
ncbi:T9SS type A sorting domain-containing protein [Cecembia lonarensis]|nr:T9SS type A sorting domain-containing protein [Cecembia lonarensis]